VRSSSSQLAIHFLPIGYLHDQAGVRVSNRHQGFRPRRSVNPKCPALVSSRITGPFLFPHHDRNARAKRFAHVQRPEDIERRRLPRFSQAFPRDSRPRKSHRLQELPTEARNGSWQLPGGPDFAPLPFVFTIKIATLWGKHSGP